VERANHALSEIVVRELEVLPPADWWTEHDDRCLIYGTWKYGLGLNWLSQANEAISFSNASLPGLSALRERLRYLADGIRNLYFLPPKMAEIAAPWSWTEKSRVLHQMVHGGVPLSSAGSLDWAKLREICQLTHRTDQEIEEFVNDMMNLGNRRLHIHDDNAEIRITANTMNRRFVELTRLRRAFLIYSDQGMKKCFSSLPRWGNLPPSWTAQKELVFFKEICSRGFGVCREILQMSAFDGIFEGDPPLSLTDDGIVLHRLSYMLAFIERTRLETLRKQSQNVTQKDSRNLMRPSIDVHPAPTIAYDENGGPSLPILFGPSAYVIDLGHIVTDRPCFHTKEFIFPAGFKSSRLYASTIDPLRKARYTSEILDIGSDLPLFRVTMDSHPEVFFEGNFPGVPWNSIAQRVLEVRGSRHRSVRLSGPECYGLSSPVICYLIQQMDGADKCGRYVMRQFERATPKPENVEEAPVSSLLPTPIIAYDDDGSPSLPIQFTRTRYVIDLGHIVTDRPAFHSSKYIFPVGFKSSRLYASTLDPSQQVRYTSEILDTGSDVPLFRVTMDDHPEIFFEGKAPSSPWCLIKQRVDALHGPVTGCRLLSGPGCYGLSSPIICYLIQRMDGADKCVNYVMRRFESPKAK
jgi:chromodomain-helicase-DNA-binding protein 7